MKATRTSTRRRSRSNSRKNSRSRSPARRRERDNNDPFAAAPALGSSTFGSGLGLYGNGGRSLYGGSSAGRYNF